MVNKYIGVDNDKWRILLVYDFDLLDYDELSAIMDSFGLSQRNIQRSLRILSTFNSGMTISRADLRMSVVFIGKPTSNGQFWNTVVHELKHVHDAILDYYNIELDGEPSAYTIGYLLQRVVEEIAEPCKN